jgi:hypothetical protein
LVSGHEQQIFFFGLPSAAGLAASWPIGAAGGRVSVGPGRARVSKAKGGCAPDAQCSFGRALARRASSWTSSSKMKYRSEQGFGVLHAGATHVRIDDDEANDGR